MARGTSEDELIELTQLADGTLARARRAAVEARVAASPQLQALLAEQRAAINAVHGVAVSMPLTLRARLERERPDPTEPRVLLRRLRPALILSGLAAVAGASLALIIPAPSGPSVAQAAALAGRPPNQAAPTVARGMTALLSANVDGAPFPNWHPAFGWRAVGTRTDALAGRKAVTVFYEKRGVRIAYTIIDGPAAPWPARAERTVYDGTELRAFPNGNRVAVTWRRKGHTCVLSGPATTQTALLHLAAWRASGGVPF